MWALLPLPGGGVLAGTRHGVVMLRGRRTVHLSDLPLAGGARVFGLVRDGAGWVWASTAQGAVRFRWDDGRERAWGAGVHPRRRFAARRGSRDRAGGGWEGVVRHRRRRPRAVGRFGDAPVGREAGLPSVVCRAVLARPKAWADRHGALAVLGRARDQGRFGQSGSERPLRGGDGPRGRRLRVARDAVRGREGGGRRRGRPDRPGARPRRGIDHGGELSRRGHRRAAAGRNGRGAHRGAAGSGQAPAVQARHPAARRRGPGRTPAGGGGHPAVWAQHADVRVRLADFFAEQNTSSRSG